MTEVRKTILQTALQLFSLRGYESVGIQEIVDTSGITKPTLYYHFGNKRGLLAAVVDEHGGALVEVLRRGSEYHHDLGANLNTLFGDTICWAQEHPDFFRLAQTLFSSAPETIGAGIGAPLYQGLITLLEELFRNAAGDHGNMVGRERIYAASFMGLLSTWATISINGELKISPDLRFRIIHHFMHGIFS